MKKRMLSLLLTTALVTALFAGCGSTTDKEAQKESDKQEGTNVSTEVKESSGVYETVDEEPVTIKWFRSYSVKVDDEKKVQDAINEYIEPLINVKVEILNNQGTDLSLALAAGDDIDLFHADKNPAKNFIMNNAAMDITDIVKEYPTLYDTVPESVWESAKWFDGRNYSVPVYKEMGNGRGLTVSKEAIEKFDWDLSGIKELSDLTPYLEEAYENGYDSPLCSSSVYFNQLWAHEFSWTDVSTLSVRRDDPDTIVNFVETEEYREYCELLYEWNQAGYINQDELVSSNADIKLAEKYQDGRTVFGVWTNVPAGDEIASNRYDTEVVCIDLTGTYLTTGSAFGSNYLINKNTEKVDACMKFLGLLYTDRTLADLACFGIEGEHYTRDEEGKVQLVDGSGYRYNGVWCVTHVAAPSLMAGEADNKIELYEEFNSSVLEDCLKGFIPDTSMLTAEISALSGVASKYTLTLARGFYDPDEYIDQYIAEQKAAGMDKVVAEFQRQYDEWRAGK